MVKQTEVSFYEDLPEINPPSIATEDAVLKFKAYN